MQRLLKVKARSTDTTFVAANLRWPAGSQVASRSRLHGASPGGGPFSYLPPCPISPRASRRSLSLGCCRQRPGRYAPRIPRFPHTGPALPRHAPAVVDDLVSRRSIAPGPGPLPPILQTGVSARPELSQPGSSGRQAPLLAQRPRDPAPPSRLPCFARNLSFSRSLAKDSRVFRYARMNDPFSAAVRLPGSCVRSDNWGTMVLDHRPKPAAVP